jgi:NADH-quinone oxidoreductase subunit L
MTIPLLVLAVLSVIGGYHFFAESIFGEKLFHATHLGEHVSTVPILAVAVFAIGSALGAWIYQDRARDPVRIPLFANRFYFDEMYSALVSGTQDLLASVSGWLDRYILDGCVVRGAASLTWGLGYAFRMLQFGNLQGYAFIFGAGVVTLMYLMIG